MTAKLYGKMKFKRGHNQQAELLQSLSFFKEIDKRTLLKVANMLRLREVKAGEAIFEEGDFDYTLYIIETGRVKIHAGFHTFATFGPSQYFGEYAILDSSPRSTTATAIEDSKLWSLGQKDFFSVFGKLALSILKALVLRLRDYNVLESELTLKNAEIRKQKGAIEEQTKELELLNQTKDKFFAIIAHDLKSPFSTVVSLSDLLADEFDTLDHDKQREFAVQISKCANKTYNLLENLLQWSLLQTGRQEIIIGQNNISSIITDNIELLKGIAQSKGISIFWNSTNSYIASFDANMINSVVRNLLNNALKFTPTKGKILVLVNDSDNSWKISIADNGIGISESDQQNLFKIGSNPSKIGTQQEHGTGLGLILCHDFVKKNGGEIGVESKIGQGSTFWFTIPKIGIEEQ